MVTGKLTIAIVAVATLFASCTYPLRKHESGIFVEPRVWDFGTVKRGETVTGKVILRNFTDTTFTVSVYSTCDCLEASLEAEEISPNTSITISLSYLGDAVKEHVSKSLFVKLNNSAERQLRVDVTGKVIPGEKPHLVALPNPIPIERSHGTSNFLEISNRGKEELAISQIRCYGCESNAMNLRLGSGEKAVIVVKLVPEWQGKRWLEIESNDPVTPLRKIAIIELP